MDAPRCAPLGLPVLEPVAVTTTELQAALGRHVSDPVVRQLAAALGKPLDDRSQNRYRLLNFHDQGVTIVLDNEQYVEAIDLHGRTYQVRSYPHALPSGLSFKDRSDDIEKRFGKPLFCATRGRCTYADGGLEIVYGPDACVSTLTLHPTAEPGTALVSAIRIRPEKRGGARGILVGIDYTINVGAPARLSASLVDGRENAPEVITGRDELQRAGRLGWTVAHDSGVIITSVSRFIPHSALVLSEGTHVLTPRVVVEKQTAAGDWSAVPIRFLHGEPPVVTLDEPRCRWHRFGVQRVVVAERDYDGGESSRPDLRWQVALEKNLHTSSEQGDTFTGRWSERTPWFRACSGDDITIGIQDVDAAFHDDIGGRTIELSELVRIAGAREVLSFGPVKELVLSAVEERETLAAPARRR
ncbi:MAG: hypothetical protein HOV80_11120 [Polyangiaceae bacterium]|nr:hypothetical protein [Polyangiaceae bacterium]